MTDDSEMTTVPGTPVNGGDGGERRGVNKFHLTTRVVLVILAVNTLLAMAALIFVVVDLHKRQVELQRQADIASAVSRQNKASLDAVQQSRYHAAFDSCRLFRIVIRAATPPARQGRAEAFVAKTPLSDCKTYASRAISARGAVRKELPRPPVPPVLPPPRRSGPF